MGQWCVQVCVILSINHWDILGLKTIYLVKNTTHNCEKNTT